MSRSKKLMKLLKRALKMEHLYTPKELEKLKREAKELEKYLNELEENNSKGFGK